MQKTAICLGDDSSLGTDGEVSFRDGVGIKRGMII